ncbi:nitrilase [Chromatiales bacterium (ex Bugula neritina AB1)]|nr:nitrilase [Chromatiales bacterium (ex Bugula neritina AB1)]
MTATIAALQTSPQATMKAALDETLSLAAEAVASGAIFLGTPEYCGGLVSDGAVLVPPHANEEDHAYLAGLKQFSAENGVWFLVGSIAITASEGRIYNRGYLLDNTGLIRSRYSKIHLFDIQLSESEVYRESASVVAGSEAVVMDTPVGSMGHTICYDLRFPRLYRELAHSGAEILAIPAAFTKRTGEMHWHMLNRARAVENGAFVFSPCSVGDVPGGGAAYGHSLIIDPMGTVIADGGDATGVVLAEIDLALVEQARSRIPSLYHDREFMVAGNR